MRIHLPRNSLFSFLSSLLRHQRRFGKLGPAQVYELLSQKDPPLILDVRNPDEFVGERGHIDGATLIPLPELEQRIGELQSHRTQPIVTV
jgi:3-mercaptopyruvate sulfurtransferase SseA